MIGRVVAAALMLLGGGCGGSKGLYDWGPYEASVYALCHDFTDEDLLAQIEALNAHVEGLRAEDRLPAPGVHSHLGYLEYLAGNADAAARNFEAEKDLYPESTVFIDGLLRRMKK